MSAERLSEIQSSGSGVGIRGMRERVLQLSGRMSIESDSSGTRIHVAIPTTKTVSRQRMGSDVPVQTAVRQFSANHVSVEGTGLPNASANRTLGGYNVRTLPQIPR